MTAAVRAYRDRAAFNRPNSLLPDAVIQTFAAACQDAEKHINSRSNQLLSAIAIQQYVLQRVVTCHLKVNRSEVEEYTNEAVEYLRYNNRVFRLDEFIGDGGV